MAEARTSKKLFLLRIDLPAFISAVLFAGLIFLYLIPGFEKVMMDGRRRLIYEMTSSAYSLLQYYNSLSLNGVMTPEESMERAADAISQIRYGENLKDYFWITDMHPRMIRHPYRPDLNGQDLNGYYDSRGKQIFVDFVNAVSESGESYVEYMWQWNDDSTRIVPKLSFVKLFKPWGWVIGTGMYIEDVKDEINKIERKALIISGLIGILLVVLLSFISRQSHRIESERITASKELEKSRELYKTLSEAASEGIIIWTDSGLKANKTLLALLDYTEPEFLLMDIRSVVSSPALAGGGSASDFYNDLQTGIQSECILRTRDGRPVRSYISFSRLETGGEKAVLTVLRPVKSFAPRVEFSAGTSLIDNLSVGFFRITFGSRNRFIYLSAAAYEMLGFRDEREVLDRNIDAFFASRDELKTFKKRLAAREKIRGETFLLKKKDGDEILVILNAEVVENPSGELWCEGTLEYLSAMAPADSGIFSDISAAAYSAILESPVSLFVRPPLYCNAGTQIGNALTMMESEGYSLLVVNDDKGSPVGSVRSETAAFHLAGGGALSDKVSEIMDSPPFFISGKTSMYKAAAILAENRQKSLLVNDEDGNLLGLISAEEISAGLSVKPFSFDEEISKSSTSELLFKCYLKGRETAIRMLQGGADPSLIMLYLSEIGDRICSRVIELCLEHAGPPPCRFSFIQTGSAGRKEQTLLTDQDNAIIFEDTDDEEKLASARKYFIKLGSEINLMLHESGFRKCTGNNMAGNPQWCQPLGEWKIYFSEWIKAPGPGELLEVSIFFDFRHTAGERKLTDELREFVSSGLRTNDIFFHHYTNAWKVFQPSAASLLSDTVEIKKLIMPLTGMVRLYALRHGIEALSTAGRLRVLYNGGHIDLKTMVSLIRAWKNLSLIRLTGQAAAIIEGREPENKVDLRLMPEMMITAESAVNEIINLMQKAYNDFYASAV